MSKLAIIGSGNWGTTISCILGVNILKMQKFDNQIKMLMIEEMFEGRKLTDFVNHDHINPKYLPGVSIPHNIVGVTDPKECVHDATHLVFVVPHQFVESILDTIKPFVKPEVYGISLIKGILEKGTEIALISDLITEKLGIHMSVLSGANIASEIAKKNFSETTIACSVPDLAQDWKTMFETNYFQVGLVEDKAPVEICGALKNGVALAAGFMEAMATGFNTKAAVIRIGLMEIIRFCELSGSIKDKAIFFESFGVADLIATCYGGRNRRVAEEYIKTGKDIHVLEQELLNGQKLQGPSTVEHVCHILKKKGVEEQFPLFMGIYAVIFEKKSAECLLELLTSRKHLV